MTELTEAPRDGYVQRLVRGELAAKKRIDKYHDIALYRAKLREFAIRRLAQPR